MELQKDDLRLRLKRYLDRFLSELCLSFQVSFSFKRFVAVIARQLRQSHQIIVIAITATTGSSTVSLLLQEIPLLLM